MRNATKATLNVLVSIATAIFIAFVWWVSGYNFDHRSPDVAFFMVMSVGAWAFLSAVVVSFI